MIKKLDVIGFFLFNVSVTCVNIIIMFKILHVDNYQLFVYIFSSNLDRKMFDDVLCTDYL